MNKRRHPRGMGALLLAGLGLGCALVAGAPTLASHPARAGQTDAAAQGRVAAAYGKLPLSFEANRGQADDRVKFLSHGDRYSVALTAAGATVTLVRPGSLDPHAIRAGKVGKDFRPEFDVVRMEVVGGNPAAALEGLKKLPGSVNYIHGSDPKEWHSNIPTYEKVRAEAVYPGIDLVYYGNQRQLEYDFVVAPGADPDRIELDFSGAKAVRIAPEGDLVLETEGGELRQNRPVIYQEIEGARKPVAGGYVIRGENRVGFEVAKYDAKRPLVIDPVLSYHTYLGGGSDDLGYAIAVDAAGNAYITGSTVSGTSFPLVGPIPVDPDFTPGTSLDVFITKINAEGSAVLFSSLVGGSYHEVGLGIAVDAANKPYVTGFTTSVRNLTDPVLAPFPVERPVQASGLPPITLPGEDGDLGTPDDIVVPIDGPAGGFGDQDAFLVSLTATGTTPFISSYVGSTSIDIGTGIAVDPDGNVYIVGTTSSPSLPSSPGVVASGFDQTDNPMEDAFVVKIDPVSNPTNGMIVGATYLGGNFVDFGFGIAVEFNTASLTSDVFITGTTGSDDFPTVTPIQGAFAGGRTLFGGDAFVAKLNDSLSTLTYSTYLGGVGFDQARSIAIGQDKSAYITGITLSTDFPTTAGALQDPGDSNYDVFVTRLNPAGSGLVFSTYLGGGAADQGNGIAVDEADNAYVTGVTGSTDFPTKATIQKLRGIADAFATKLSPAGVIIYSTYLGGNGYDEGFGIAADAKGNAYIVGITNSTNALLEGSLQPGNGGGYDVLLAKVPELKEDPGGGDGTTNLQITPQSLRPFKIKAGQTQFQDLTIENRGEAPVTLNLSIQDINGAFDVSGDTGITLEPATSLDNKAIVRVTFNPPTDLKKLRTFNAVLKIRAESSSGPFARDIQLRGKVKPRRKPRLRD